MKPQFTSLIVFAAALSIGPAAAQPLAEAAPAVHARQYDEQVWLQRFYALRGNAPTWDAARADEAIGILERAAAHGLSPSAYGAHALRGMLARGGADFERALTRAMLHYLADLRIGRIPSDYFSAGKDLRLQQFDPVAILSDALASGNMAAAIDDAAPRFPFYRRVRDALAAYRVLAAATGPPLPPMHKPVEGHKFAAAPALRARLVLLGDLPDLPAPEPDRTYTTELADGVRRFQARHGLAEDGVIGPETMDALNVPLARRVHQLELALERMRWIPDLRAGPVIAVNLPAYRLWAFQHRDGARDMLEMRVIVGEAIKTPTPLFIGSMRHLEFNPYWNVPRSIAMGELLPKLRRDAGYLSDNDMEFVPVAGGAATSAVNGDTLAALGAGRLRIRQRPGPQNALGAVKFAMPNPMHIYLHSTAARELFDKNRRDLSHGCIRVEKPEELAQFVLADQPAWNAAAVEMAMRPGPTRTVALAAPLPVVLFYTTAMVDRAGQVLFPRDVYKRDPMLEQALAQHVTK